jgi:hypothetical protein
MTLIHQLDPHIPCKGLLTIPTKFPLPPITGSVAEHQMVSALPAARVPGVLTTRRARLCAAHFHKNIDTSPCVSSFGLPAGFVTVMLEGSADLGN